MIPLYYLEFRLIDLGIFSGMSRTYKIEKDGFFMVV